MKERYKKYFAPSNLSNLLGVLIGAFFFIILIMLSEQNMDNSLTLFYTLFFDSLFMLVFGIVTISLNRKNLIAYLGILLGLMFSSFFIYVFIGSLKDL